MPEHLPEDGVAVLDVLVGVQDVSVPDKVHQPRRDLNENIERGQGAAKASRKTSKGNIGASGGSRQKGKYHFYKGRVAVVGGHIPITLRLEGHGTHTNTCMRMSIENGKPV